jgi:hypothetical protein
MAITKVTNSVLADGSIHTANLADDAITAAKVADAAIDSAHIGTGAIDTAHIADANITTAKLADSAITTVKIADSAITTAKIADANITTAKLADDAVTAAKLASDVAGTGLTSTNGVLSVNATGASGLQDGAVSTVKLADSAVTTAKIADANVTTAKIADSAVTTVKIAADAVDGTKIADDSIDSEHYVDGSIDTAHIADSQITTAKIADDAVTIAKIADAAIVTEAEGIGSNDNDTTLPTSAAVKDYVDTEVGAITDNDTLGALTATDGGFVVGDGTNFVIETGSTARDSIGLGTSGHIQFHCLGIGQAASTVNGQIDATTVYAGTFGKDSGDYINWTTDTQMDFYVNGSNEMRLEADGDLHVDGDVYAASTTVSSDEKLKENIEKIENPLEILDSINGVNFNFIKGGKKSSGVIAQDVEKVMPHLVKEVNSFNSAEKHLTVDYNGLIGLLIESVKTLSEKVKELENR